MLNRRLVVGAQLIGAAARFVDAPAPIYWAV
jgi:hypothetical protein